MANLWWSDALKQWLDRDEAPADCLSDLKTSQNKLSVYEVATEEDAEQVAAALALSRAIGQPKMSLPAVAGLVFDEDILPPLGIKLDKKTGKTKDAKVNDWHLDLIELTASQLARFALSLLRANQPRTFFEATLLKRIQIGIESGAL